MEGHNEVHPSVLASPEDIERLCVRNLLASTQDRVFFKDLDSRFLLVSQGFLEQLAPGLSLDDLLGKTDFDIFSAEHAQEAYKDEQQIIRSGEPISAKVERETYHDRPDAWVATTKRPLRDGAGRIVGTFGFSRDVTEQTRAKEALAHQALHDPLTGLPNRLALLDRLAQALKMLERQPGRVALLFIDLDDFKSVNDTLGHEAGDGVLTEVARRLARVARRTDTVARFGGDEFVLLCTALHHGENLRVIGDRVQRALRAPIRDRPELTVTASIGAVSASRPKVPASVLVQHADFAMYEAKRGGGNRLELYDPKQHSHVASERGLADDLLRGALERGELFVAYQPLFRLSDQALSGVEALIRWRHPDRGTVAPSEFVQVAEAHGLIDDIDMFVLDEACRQLAEWSRADASLAACAVAVNLSAEQLRDTSLPGRVIAVLERHRIEPSRLRLEITETALIGEPDDASRVLASLSAHGIVIALDDFGTGYSTLAHLQHLRADVLKIDRSFVAHLGRDSRDREIVHAVIAMAHALKMTVVGEGIETTAQRDELLAAGCDEGQGYLFAKPMAPEQITHLSAARQAPLHPMPAAHAIRHRLARNAA